MNTDFLHDRPWISPWIKSIYNELDIIIHVFASRLSGHQQTIVTSSAEGKPKAWGKGTMRKDRRFYRHLRPKNNVWTPVTNCSCAQSSVIFVFNLDF